ncbi:hypothetical protein CR513_24253, partial [Mucuna pruriens]
MDYVVSNQVWNLVEFLNDSQGNIERHKERLIDKGFTHREGIDYIETFAIVSKKESLQVIKALVAHFDFELHQMDMKTMFFNGDLEEEVYMKQPKGFSSGDGEHLIHKERSLDILGLSQETYINKFLVRFNIKKCSPSVASSMKGARPNLNQCPKNDFEQEHMKILHMLSLLEALCMHKFAPDLILHMLSEFGKISE